jgi:hypothetical protein
MSTQQPCVKKYFNQRESVGFRISQSNSSGIVTDGAVSFKFYKPWIILGMIESGNGGGPSEVNMASPVNHLTYQYMIEQFFVFSAQANAENGTDPSGAITYTPLGTQADYSYYFQKFINTNLNEFNLLSLKYPEALMGSFWRTLSKGGGDFNDSQEVFYGFTDFLQRSTDLNLWGAPGQYSVNTANAFATDSDGFNDMFNSLNIGGGTDMSWLIIEQVFQP